MAAEIYHISEQAAFEAFDDGALILKLNDLTLTELNLTARDVLIHTDGINDVNRVAELIATEYGIDLAAAEQDIRELYANLLEEGILENSQPEAGKDKKDDRDKN